MIDALERLGAEVEVERIDAELVLDPARRAAVHERIRAVSRALGGGALAVPHPVTMLAARR